MANVRYTENCVQTQLDAIENTLETCPCCGKPALLNAYKARKGFESNVQCSACGMSYSSGVTYDTELEAATEAANGWNTRVNK